MYLYYMSRDIPAVTVTCPLCVYLIFSLDDIVYGLFHKFLHLRSVYSYVHKRHHMIAEPYAGYIHASMEHPLEMLGGLLIHTHVLLFLEHFHILDAASMWIHVVLKAIVAIANHTGCDYDSVLFSIERTSTITAIAIVIIHNIIRWISIVDGTL